jgi:hypothetical protein
VTHEPIEDHGPIVRDTSDVVGQDGRQVSTSRRTVLKAGWIAPVVLALNLPNSSYAANNSDKKPKKPKD